MTITKGVQMLYDDILNYITNKITFKQLQATTNYSERHLRRLIRGVKQEGITSLIHKNTGRKPANCISIETEKEILDLYLNHWNGCNFKYFYDCLDSNLQEKLSYQSLQTIMKKNLIISPKANRKTKHALKKLIKENNSNKIENTVIQKKLRKSLNI